MFHIHVDLRVVASLTNGRASWLSDKYIYACLQLLQSRFPQIGGFQDPLLGTLFANCNEITTYILLIHINS